MNSDGGYGIDLGSVVSHVAASLDRAAPAALSLGDLAAAYKHKLHGDLTRVREHEGCATDADATLWLIHRAAEALVRNGKGGRVIEEGGMYRLADGLTIEDLRWGHRKIHAVAPDPHKVLGDPFNPQSGRLSENVRKNTGKDTELDALRASMREAGWIPGHPAVIDERGVVISGHRRLAVAKELGIKPDVVRFSFSKKHGNGDQADLRRMDVALLSNYGFKKLTPDERAEIAKYLQETRGMTQAEIAAGLGVSQSQAQRDLAKSKIITHMGNDLGKPPKGKRQAEQAELDRKVADGLAAGKTQSEIGRELGIGDNSMRLAKAAGRYEAGPNSQQQSPSQTTSPSEDAPSDGALQVLEQMVNLALGRPREERGWLIAQLMARMP